MYFEGHSCFWKWKIVLKMDGISMEYMLKAVLIVVYFGIGVRKSEVINPKRRRVGRVGMFLNSWKL